MPVVPVPLTMFPLISRSWALPEAPAGASVRPAPPIARFMPIVSVTVPDPRSACVEILEAAALVKARLLPLNTKPAAVEPELRNEIDPVVVVMSFVLVRRSEPLKIILLPDTGPTPAPFPVQFEPVLQSELEPLPIQVAVAAEATPPKALQAIASNATDGIPFNRVKIEENFIVFALVLKRARKLNERERRENLSRWGTPETVPPSHRLTTSYA